MIMAIIITLFAGLSVTIIVFTAIIAIGRVVDNVISRDDREGIVFGIFIVSSCLLYVSMLIKHANAIYAFFL